jgi:hypothetical protein
MPVGTPSSVKVTFVESVDCSSTVVSVAACPVHNQERVSDDNVTPEIHSFTLWPGRALQCPGLLDFLAGRKRDVFATYAASK